MQTSETRITLYLTAGIAAPLKAYPQVKQAPIYSNQPQKRREIFTSIIKICLLQSCTTTAETTSNALVKGSEISI